MSGKVIETRDPIFLCRCGGSKNKPFCDGSHRRVGLKD
jgi:CDGSH-type Zn-finger protein